MQSINRHSIIRVSTTLYACLLFLSLPVLALESDRQQPLDINANSTDGTLGDGVTTLRGSVEIHQGSLHISADEAEVNKIDGRVSSVKLSGQPAFLEQEIEEQGLVQATANIIVYQVANGLVTLEGSADVKHPQYQISGELLTYDLNLQHFEGSSDKNGNGRIHILLDPEVIDDSTKKKNEDDGDNGDDVDNPGKDGN